jgi:hypothetical protein
MIGEPPQVTAFAPSITRSLLAGRLIGEDHVHEPAGTRTVHPLCAAVTAAATSAREQVAAVTVWPPPPETVTVADAMGDPPPAPLHCSM